MIGFKSALNNLYAISAGLVSGASIVHINGINDSIPNGSWATISPSGNNLWRLTSAAVLNIKAGGNANDTSAGTGAREVRVHGLNASGQFITELIATNGISASSNTKQLFCRVYHTEVTKVGTRYGSNTGDIIIQSGGVDLIHIEASSGLSEFGGYTIELGKTGYLISVSANVAANKSGDLRSFSSKNINNSSAPFDPNRKESFIREIVGQYKEPDMTPILKLDELTDLWFEGYGNGASTSITIDCKILLLDN